MSPTALPTLPLITATELAILDRLKRGLGRMVSTVESYGGEFDDENLPEVLQRFPAVWVTFGGVHKTEPVSVTRDAWRAEGSFVVMAGTRSLRSESAARQGGPALREVGSSLLIAAVRRLLAQQDMGLAIRPLAPGAIRTLYNSRLQGQAFSVFALEFHTAWVEEALPPGAYPQRDASGMDAVFALYQGQLDPADPVWASTQLRYVVNGPVNATPTAQDNLTMPGGTTA